MGKRNLILLLPISDILKKIQSTMEQDFDCELYTLEDIDEAHQLAQTLGASLWISSDPQLSFMFMEQNAKFIKKDKSKFILTSQKELSEHLETQLKKLGINEIIYEPITEKTLKYKINLIIKSIPLNELSNLNIEEKLTEEKKVIPEEPKITPQKTVIENKIDTNQKLRVERLMADEDVKKIDTKQELRVERLMATEDDKKIDIKEKQKVTSFLRGSTNTQSELKFEDDHIAPLKMTPEEKELDQVILTKDTKNNLVVEDDSPNISPEEAELDAQIKKAFELKKGDKEFSLFPEEKRHHDLLKGELNTHKPMNQDESSPKKNGSDLTIDFTEDNKEDQNKEDLIDEENKSRLIKEKSNLKIVSDDDNNNVAQDETGDDDNNNLEKRDIKELKLKVVDDTEKKQKNILLFHKPQKIISATPFKPLVLDDDNPKEAETLPLEEEAKDETKEREQELKVEDDETPKGEEPVLQKKQEELKKRSLLNLFGLIDDSKKEKKDKVDLKISNEEEEKDKNKENETKRQSKFSWKKLTKLFNDSDEEDKKRQTLVKSNDQDKNAPKGITHLNVIDDSKKDKSSKLDIIDDSKEKDAFNMDLGVIDDIEKESPSYKKAITPRPLKLKALNTKFFGDSSFQKKKLEQDPAEKPKSKNINNKEEQLPQEDSNKDDKVMDIVKSASIQATGFMGGEGNEASLQNDIKEIKNEYSPSTKGFEFIISLCNFYRIAAPEKVLELLAKTLLKQHQGHANFLLYLPETKEFKDLYVANLLLKELAPTSQRDWIKSKINNKDFWSTLKIPDWKEKVFTFPFYNGSQLRGIAHCEFQSEIKPDFHKEIEVLLEISRTLLTKLGESEDEKILDKIEEHNKEIGIQGQVKEKLEKIFSFFK